MNATHPQPSLDVLDGDSSVWTRDDWNTPDWVLRVVREFGGGKIALDPCSNAHSTVGAELELDKHDDSLTVEWDVDGLVFVNPPYSRDLYPLFAAKIAEEAKLGREIIALVPTNTETEAWIDGFWLADAICFTNRRVRFLKLGEVQGSPAGGSALVYFGSRPHEFKQLFEVDERMGKVVFPQASL